MKAILLREAGAMRYEDVASPTAAEDGDEAIVELRAASVNRRDTLIRHPPSEKYAFELPLIPGSDGAGVVAEGGDDVVLYPPCGWGEGKVPDAGWGLLGGPLDGTYAELIKVPRANLFPKPTHLSWEEAAALGVAGLTAYAALFGAGGLQAGETVLVLGASSGVATLAIQLARAAGARVLVTSSSDRKLAAAAELGAEGGFLYTDPEWARGVPEVDLVIDSVGLGWEQILGLLRAGGRLVTLGATGNSQVRLDPRSVYLRSLSIRGSLLGSPSQFGAMLTMVERHRLRPVIDSVWPLREASSAHERMLAGEHFGKLVLVPEAAR